MHGYGFLLSVFELYSGKPVLTGQQTCGALLPVDEKENQPFHLSFNPCLKVDFQTSRITSDGGLLLMRELDERLGLSPNGPASSRGPCDHGPIQPTRKN